MSLTERNQTETQINQIEQDIRNSQKLASLLIPLKALSESYEEEKTNTISTAYESKNDGPFDDQNYFLLGSQYLEKKYSHMRKIRGDGNCYYRAFLYALCENLIDQSKKTKAPMNMQDDESLMNKRMDDDLDRLIQYAINSIDEVVKYGYDKFALEMFHEEFVDLLQSLKKDETFETIKNNLYNTLTEENGSSEYCTWYLRVLTAAYLKSDPCRFQSYMEDEYTDINTFCAREVEPMGRECGMLQVIALAESVGVHVKIEYLDGRPFDNKGLTLHQFGNMDSKTKITLLYRPGHYDILYEIE